MEKFEYDVLIVGYGATGKMTANLLGKAGWKVGVVDPFPSPYPLPKAVRYGDEVLRTMQSVLPNEKINEVSQLITDDYTWFNGEGQILLEIDSSSDGISGWPSAMFYNQAELETVLAEGAETHPNVHHHLGNRVIDIQQFEDRVEVIFRPADNLGFVVPNTEPVMATAKYVVGSDGANSIVRSKMHHETADLGFSSTFLVIDVKTDKVFTPTNYQLCDPKRPISVMSGGKGRRRWEYMLLPGETPQDFDDQTVIWDLLKDWDITPENAELERHVSYTFNARWVQNWRDKRLFVAGDAAHLTPPFLGEGLGSGIRDANNIAWKLDHVLSGIADETLLDTYSQERKPHIAQLITNAEFLGKVITTTDEAQAKARDERFLSGEPPAMAPFPILEDGVLYKAENSSLAGELSLQRKVTYNGETGLFDDLVGNGWQVITWKQDAKELLNNDQLAFLEKLNAKLVTITDEEGSAENTAFDVTGEYGEYFKENNLEAVVVRPDFYNYAGLENAADLPKVIDTLQSMFAKK